jgi:predicted ferric reductase
MSSAPRPQSKTATAAPLPKRRRTARFFAANFVLAVIGAEGGMAVALGIFAQPFSDWTDPGLLITAISRVVAMAGTYFALITLVLAARIPWLEREIGQDRLIKWHRMLAPYSLYLIAAHVGLVSLGYGILADLNTWQQFWALVLDTPWMMPALAGFWFMLIVGFTSYKRARSRMTYETWWLIHVYSYLGIALSFMHQITSGSMFVNNEGMRKWWIALYVAVFGSILLFRWIVPFVRSSRHDLRVEKVVRETRNTISIVVRGRDLGKLGAQGGQFFGWRFLDGKHWWESHPYSISASPRNDRLRVTVKDLGDASSSLAKLRPGTKVLIEGPYGTFTADKAEGEYAVLIAGGVGITPIRALLEEIPKHVEIDLIWRASTENDLPLRREIEALAEWRGARIHWMVGSRHQFPMSPKKIVQAVPHIALADVFLCGPDGMVNEARKSLHRVGVRPDQLHDEAFAY